MISDLLDSAYLHGLEDSKERIAYALAEQSAHHRESIAREIELLQKDIMYEAGMTTLYNHIKINDDTVYNRALSDAASIVRARIGKV